MSEDTVEDWYNKAGLPFDTFTALGLGTVTVNININYRKEARLGQHLTISTEPISDALAKMFG